MFNHLVYYFVCNYILVNTAPSSSPVGSSASAVNSTSFILSWNPLSTANSNGITRLYIVFITELETGSVWTYSTLTTELHVQLLHPYYSYNCSVSAVTITAGPYSSPITILTEIDGMYI